MNREKINILFVDDEEAILHGLKRMSRSMRKQWHRSYALGGEAALNIMASEAVDVLVTDLRMPGMDGVELLRETKKQYPHIIRIVLSGHYDIEGFIQSGWPTHRFLAKPCDAESLKNTIDHVCALRHLLDNQQIRAVIGRANRLPTLPDIYFEIEQELKSENSSMRKIGDIIARDAGITAKVLQLANSPVFGSIRRIDSPAQAVVMLGAEVIKSLALYVQSCSEIPVPKGVSLDVLLSRCEAVGRLARDIAVSEGAPKAVCADAFLAGMLHNIGSLIILASFPDEYRRIITRSEQEGRPIWQLEQEVLGAGHAEIGACLLSLWGLSTEIVKAVAYHIHPSHCPHADASFALTAVHVANALEQELSADGVLLASDVDCAYLERRGVMEKLPHWRALHQQMISGHGEKE